MKKLLFIIALLVSFTCYSQDKVLKDTTIKNVPYKLYEGGRGGHYVIVTSKSGTTYKRYIKR